MYLLEGVIALVAAVFAVGALARFALPGPDPLPIWFTVAIGVAGAILGGLIAGIYIGFAGESERSFVEAQGIFVMAAVAGATFVLFLYRWLGQERPITGPRAQRLPLKPRGLNRILRGKPHSWLEETAEPGAEPVEQLAKLVALRDAGRIDAAEFDRRKAALVEKI